MYYYTVHLPIGTTREFVYSHNGPLKIGCRVLVRFNRKLCMGISGARSLDALQKGIRYLPIDEVLDEEPVITDDLYKLGLWMASYYHSPVGKCLFACLPSYLQPALDTQIRWIAEGEYDQNFRPLADMLADGLYHSMAQIHKDKPSLHIYRLADEAEAKGLIEIRRKLAHKDKQRTVNYVRIKSALEDPLLLPAKQLEAYALLQEAGAPVAMAILAHQISYSPLKALAKKGIIEIYPKKLDWELPVAEASPAKEVVLTDEQNAALVDIEQQKGFGVNLLYGVTGSGKTEIYLERIKACLAEGKNVIFLIPEIALTPQMVDRFRSSFGDVLAIMHSQLSERERLVQWQRIKGGQRRIVIGARSAVLAPLDNLGLIIVDEEHEQSYKQDTQPRYHGRDMAIIRARLAGAQVILGSATPALESWNNVASGKYRLQTLSKRPLHYSMPKVQIVDMRDEYTDSMMSDLLVASIAQRLEQKEQVILFQNRRGYSSFLQCMKCGSLITCDNCEISMYYHRDRDEMHCHYCGAQYPSPRKCPSCGSHSFSYGAAGTQKLEQILRVLFPDARLMRMDSDSTKQRDKYKTMYDSMKSREVDILLGTQMISKGLDFPGVTLVGIVNADISLNIPDFRAAERSFQLITQVAGRSGRGDDKGEVIIQSHNPEHYAIIHASRQDYPGFATEEMQYRKRLHYPPYYKLARIVYQAKDREQISSEMAAIIPKLEHLKAKYPDGELIVLGPAPAPFGKLNNLWRYHLILKGQNPSVISSAIAWLEMQIKPGKGISSYVDVDPLSLM